MLSLLDWCNCGKGGKGWKFLRISTEKQAAAPSGIRLGVIPYMHGTRWFIASVDGHLLCHRICCQWKPGAGDQDSSEAADSHFPLDECLWILIILLNCECQCRKIHRMFWLCASGLVPKTAFYLNWEILYGYSLFTSCALFQPYF